MVRLTALCLSALFCGTPMALLRVPAQTTETPAILLAFGMNRQRTGIYAEAIEDFQTAEKLHPQTSFVSFLKKKHGTALALTSSWVNQASSAVKCSE